MNQITLVGNVKADNGIDYKTSQSGTPYSKFTIVVPRSGPNAKGKDFFRVTCWRDLADRAASELGDGALVVVTGKITNDRYQDAEGNWKDSWTVHASDFTVAGAERSVPAASSAPAPAPAAAAAAPAPAAAALSLEDDF